MTKKFIGIVPVNHGTWKNFTATDGRGRGDGWSDAYFQEAAFNFGWLPKNCYGKFAIEMKESHDKDTDIDVAIGFQKAIRDGGAGICERVVGSEIKLGKYDVHCQDRQRRWELYESNYFKLPEYDKVVLLWLLRKHNDPTGVLSIAMWSLAIFEDVPDETPN